MKITKILGDWFDTDIALRDAALDPHNRPTRRMIANAALGMEVEDAYYSVRELREAAEWVHEGEPRGRAKLASILGAECDDFQRCIFYALAGRGVVLMIDDLFWLEELLEARGRVAGGELRAGRKIMPLINPYVAPEPDGPVGKIDADFELGASWWMDPALAD